MKRYIAVALAALLVVSGVGMAAPGNAPDDAGAANGQAADERPADAGPSAVGPDGGLPGPVPEFVGEIHDRIEQGLSGLGEAIAELASDASPGQGGPSEN